MTQEEIKERAHAMWVRAGKPKGKDQLFWEEAQKGFSWFDIGVIAFDVKAIEPD